MKEDLYVYFAFWISWLLGLSLGIILGLIIGANLI